MSCFPTKTCQIKRDVKGHTDPETAQWVEGGEKLVATVEADIQSKSGQERATQLQTKYESDYVAFIDFEDMVFEPGYLEIKKGDILINESGQRYTIVFPGKWDDHYEPDLKEKI